MERWSRVFSTLVSPNAETQRKDVLSRAEILEATDNKDDAKGKFHIARLAKDVHDLIQWLKKKQICTENQQFSFVGTSMGCAVIWSFVELFGESEVKNYTFVDQAPLQNVRSDWCLGSTGCFDEVSLKNLQSAVLKGPDLSEFADGKFNALCVAEGSTLTSRKK
ncbi:unnamed protein product [Bathycoccus prasinos]